MIKIYMPLLEKFSSAAIFHRPDNVYAKHWVQKLATKFKQQKITLHDRPIARQPLFILGGDGTILEAVRKYHRTSPLFIGMNLGSVGFLASVRKPAKFNQALEQIFKGKYWIAEKMLIQASVQRNGKEIVVLEAMNEILIQNPLGMVHISASIGDYVMQEIRGTGVLVATPTGSTAYNLSAHGPLVMPSLEAIIMSEILDHNIPTPSMVLDAQQEIILRIEDFRQRELLSLSATEEKFDVILSADGEALIPLQKNDTIIIKRHKRPVRFVELEQNYFLKSIQEKFSFR
jgi:NAD+ kinase